MDLKKTMLTLTIGAVGAVGMAITVLTGIAVITGFKSSGQVDNTTADLFIAGLVVFGTFLEIIVLAVVGKIIYQMFTPGN